MTKAFKFSTIKKKINNTEKDSNAGNEGHKNYKISRNKIAK